VALQKKIGFLKKTQNMLVWLCKMVLANLAQDAEVSKRHSKA
jgi:hypothetical protein